MRDPRILVVTPDFPPDRGGIQHLTHRLVCQLHGVRTRVVTLSPYAAGTVELPPDCELKRVRRRFSRRLSIACLNARAVWEALAFRPDVVLSGHIVGLPATLTMAKLLGVPCVQYVHGAELTTRPRLARAACRSAAAVIAVSRYTMELIRGLGTPAPVHLIPPGVEADPPPRVSRSRRPILLTVSRLDNLYKGHDVLLRALPLVRARVPGVSWVVIGDGALRPVYEAMAEATGLRAAVRFLGSVHEAERDRWYGEAAVFVMVSRLTPNGGEGFGIVYLEAALHGLPAVAGGVGGARDAVRDGVTGLLADPEDHVAVAEAVTRILTDGPYARALSLAATRHARCYSWPAIGAQVQEVLLRGAERAGR